jgi:hypothetical protein
MSWFKRSPPKHPPHKTAQQPHRSSPATERMMDEAKKTNLKDSLQRKLR